MTEKQWLQTGSQTVGPFFHDALIVGGENILVNEKTQGQRITIEGTVFDGDGAPVPDAMIELWQPDASGIFNHPADPRHAHADKEFRGFGRADTVNEGKFYFQTIKPGRIVGVDGQRSAPYINVRLFSRGLLIHAVTRIHFEDEPSNQADTLLNSLDPIRRTTLFARRIEAGGRLCYRFDIHLQGAGETIFFDV